MTMPKPIRTESDHAEALREIARLIDAPPGTPEAERLEVLAVLVAEYERRAFEDPPEPADVLETAMQMQGRTQAELSAVLGSRARASEVLARRRGLSAEQAERVASAWGLPLRLLGGGAARVRKPKGAAATAALVGAAVLAAVGLGLFADAARGLPSVAPVVALAAPAADRVDVRTLPPHVYQAVMSAQDARFFVHRGYDSGAIASAAARDLSPARWAHPDGGSTLTQQLAKSVLLKDEPKGVRRKIREMLLARAIERRLGKEEVLNAWLNSVYYGAGAIGLADASRAYFGVEPGRLTVGQAAYLAGLPNAPERLRLDRADNRTRALQARARVVDRMVQEGYVTPALAVIARAETLAPANP